MTHLDELTDGDDYDCLCLQLLDVTRKYISNHMTIIFDSNVPKL